MTTVSEARGWLEDIAAWKSLLSDAADTILGVSSPRLTTDGRGTSDGTALPFRLDRAIDEPDKGGAGIKTEAGLLDLLGSWHRRIAGERGEPVHGSPIAYLHTVLPWAEDHTDWDALTSDIRDARDAMARITGHTRQVVGECPIPRCGGHIVADRRDEHGISDWAHCDVCDTMMHTDPEQYAEDLLRVLRDREVTPLAFVTVAEALRIWPELTKDDIRNWIRAGRMLRFGDSGTDEEPVRYHLRSLNRLAHQLIEKRERRGWRRSA